MYRLCKIISHRILRRILRRVFAWWFRLNVDQKTRSAIWKHAADAYPLECCGVLLGTRDDDVCHVFQIVPCRNVHATPESRYAIDPSELISIQRDARDLQLEIVGFYHSHPDHPPEYSQIDLQEAFWGGCSYLIVGVEQRRVTAMRSYLLHLDEKKRFFTEETLVEAVVRP